MLFIREIYGHLFNVGRDFSLGNSFFGAVKLTTKYGL